MVPNTSSVSHPHHLRRAGLLIVLVLAVGVVPVHAAQAQTGPPSLMGERLEAEFTYSSRGFQFTTECDQTGTSTISFTAEGIALGPYPGTFRESGRFIIGEQMLPPLPNPIAYPTGAKVGLVIDFDATFSIDSPVGQISGTKHLKVISEGSFGACGNVPSNQALDRICQIFELGPSRKAETNEATAMAAYDARIRTTDGLFRDTGDTSTHLVFREVFCGSGGVTQSVTQSGFREAFHRSNGVVPLNTPGQTEGGGQIQHPIGTSAESAVSFGLTVKSDGEDVKGQCNVYDHALNQHLTCLAVTNYAEIGNTAFIMGTALIDGAATDFTMELEDGGDSGIGRDFFSIEADSGYNRSGVLTEGNIKIGNGP